MQLLASDLCSATRPPWLHPMAAIVPLASGKRHSECFPPIKDPITAQARLKLLSKICTSTAFSHLLRLRRHTPKLSALTKTLQNQALAHLDGRTFSNPVDRGDYDSQMEATLAFDEVECHRDPLHCRCLSQHPACRPRWRNAGKCLAEIKPGRSAAAATGCHFAAPCTGNRTRSQNCNRQVFDFWAFGMRHHHLNQYVVENGFQKLQVRLDPHDVGTVSVLMDGQWIDARAKNEIFNGASLADWEAGPLRICRAHTIASASFQHRLSTRPLTDSIPHSRRCACTRRV